MVGTVKFAGMPDDLLTATSADEPRPALEAITHIRRRALRAVGKQGHGTTPPGIVGWAAAVAVFLAGAPALDAPASLAWGSSESTPGLACSRCHHSTTLSPDRWKSTKRGSGGSWLESDSVPLPSHGLHRLDGPFTMGPAQPEIPDARRLDGELLRFGVRSLGLIRPAQPGITDSGTVHFLQGPDLGLK